MKTICQQLNIKEFPFIIIDSNNNVVYWEESIGFWFKKSYDSNNNEIYYENSHGFWYKSEYDLKNNLIYFENSTGFVRNYKTKQIVLTFEEIAKKFNISVNDLKIKK